MIDDDFGSSDEVKIFKDEGEDEEKEFASQEELQAALSEDKSSLIQETELSIKQEALRLSDPCKYIKCLFFLLVQFRRAHFTPIFQETFSLYSNMVTFKGLISNINCLGC